MSAMSDYLEDELLDHICGVGAWSAPGTLYLALLLDTSADTDTGSTGSKELPASSNYSRQAITFGSASSGGTISNTVAVTFSASGGDWSTATHFWITDNATHESGNVLFHGALAASKQADDGDDIEFAIGEIDITLA